MRKTAVSIGAVTLLLAASACSSGGGGGGNAGANNECNKSADFPKRAIQLIVPAAAGGGTDAVGRIVANELSKTLGASINVVNKPGGGTVIGTSALAQAKPDGYTLGLIPGEITMVHWLGTTKLTYKDLTAVSLLNFDPSGITVKSNAPWKNANDLVKAAAAKPGQITASGVGTGGAWDVAMVSMLDAAKKSPSIIKWVPSDGAAPALQEVLSGGIDASFASLPENRAALDSGTVKALGIMSDKRDPNYPKVPTLKEQGIDVEFGAWRSVMGPKGMPSDVTAELNCRMGKMVKSDSFKKAMDKGQFAIKWLPTDKFKKFMSEQDKQNGAVMKKAGLAS